MTSTKYRNARNITSSFSWRENLRRKPSKPEQPFNFVAALVRLAVIFPRIKPSCIRRGDLSEPKIQGQLASLVSLGGRVNQQVNRAPDGSKAV